MKDFLMLVAIVYVLCELLGSIILILSKATDYMNRDRKRKLKSRRHPLVIPPQSLDLSNPGKIPYKDLPENVRAEMDKLGPGEVEWYNEYAEKWFVDNSVNISYRRTWVYRKKQEPLDLSNPNKIPF